MRLMCVFIQMSCLLNSIEQESCFVLFWAVLASLDLYLLSVIEVLMLLTGLFSKDLIVVKGVCEKGNDPNRTRHPSPTTLYAFPPSCCSLLKVSYLQSGTIITPSQFALGVLLREDCSNPGDNHRLYRIYIVFNLLS